MSSRNAEWEEFRGVLGKESPLGDLIVDSWARCAAAGVGTQPSLCRVPDGEIRERIRGNAELIRLSRRHLEWVSFSLRNISHVVYLVDRDGIVLHSVGNSPKILEEAGLLPGYDWSERTMGTNGAGTAIACGRPVAIVGDEHYSVRWRGFT